MKIKTAIFFLIGAIFLTCSTVSKVNKLLDEYTKLGKKLNEAADAAKSAAKDATKKSPSESTGVPVIPADKTGGKNLGEQEDGQTGTTQIDVDEDGQNEDVTVFVDNEGTTFLSWKGDAASDNEGICFLSWEKPADTLWFILTQCENNDGAFVCKVVGETAECSACNVNGECNTCNMESEEFDCKWPEINAQ